MDGNVTEFVLRIRSDQASAQSTAQALAQHKKAVEDTAKSYQQIALESRNVASATTSLKASLGSIQSVADEDIAALNNLRSSMTATAETAKQVQSQMGDGGGFGGLSGLRRTGSALTQLGLGEIGRPVQLIGDLQQVSKELDQIARPLEDFGKSLAGLDGPLGAAAAGVIDFAGPLAAAGVAAVAIAVPIAAIVIALGQFKAGLDADKQALDAALTALDKHYEAINRLTTAQAQQEIDNLKKTVGNRQDELDQLNAQIKSAMTGDGSIGAAWSDLLGTVTGAIPDMIAKRDKLQQAQDADKQSIDDLTNSLKTSSFAANDAAAAIKSIAENGDRVAQQIKDQATQQVLKGAKGPSDQALQQYADSQLSADAAKKKADQLKVNLDAEAMEYDALKKSGDQSKAVLDREQALWDSMEKGQKELDDLNNIFIPAAEHAEELATQLKADDEAAVQRGKDMAKQAADDAATQAKLTDDFIKRNQALQASDEKYAAAKTNALDKFNDANQKAQENYNAQVGKINTDFMANEIKATEDFRTQETREADRYAKERQRAIEDLQDNLTALAARGDVSAFVQAQRAGEKQLERQAEDASDADKQRIADFTRQRKDANEQRKLQLVDLQANFDKEKNQRKEAYQDQLRDLSTKHQQEKQAIETAFAEQVAQLQGNYAGLQSIHDKYYSDMNIAAANFVATQKGYLQQLYSMSLGTTNPGGPGGDGQYPRGDGGGYVPVTPHGSSNNAGRITSYAGGGNILRDGLIYAHAGEKVIRAVDNRGGGSGHTFHITNVVGDVMTQARMDAAIGDMTSQLVQALEAVR